MLYKFASFKPLLFSTILLAASFQLQAQVKGAPKNNSSSYPLSRQDTGKVTDIREKLVHLAMQNPDYEIADRQVAIAGNNLKLAQYRILGNIVAQANYNEYSIKKLPGGQLNYYPKYNVNISLPFNTFFTRSREISTARENIGIAEASKNQTYRSLRANVLTAYEDYLMHKQKLELESQVSQDIKTVYKQKERDFAESIISAEEYYPAYRAWTDEQSRMSELQRNYNIAKLQLEMYIGMTLEEAIAK